VRQGSVLSPVLFALLMDLRALDFVVDRFFMKLFQTGNIEVVRLAQRMFGFALPSFLIEKRSNKFYMVK